jgi:hypothetical protein
MTMRAQYWDVYLRWPRARRLSRRQAQRLGRELGTLVVTAEGIEGQLGKWPTQGEIEAVFAAIRRFRGRSDDLVGAIVPRGHKWQGCRSLHPPECRCDALAACSAVNGDACCVAEAFAHDPPAVVWPSDDGLVEP